MTTLLQECKVMYVDHLAVTTPVLEDTLAEYLSLEGSRLFKGPAKNIDQKVSYAFVQLRDGLVVEILSPANDSPIARHVQQGGGPYHFCYAVADIEEAIATAQGMGAKLIVDPIADVAFDGRKVSFLFHLAHGVFEFVEAYSTRRGEAFSHKAERERIMNSTVIVDTLNRSDLNEDEIEKRLGSVFLRVFPKLKWQDIPSLTMGGVVEWDSLAQIQLVMELESTFSLNIPPIKIEKLISYRDIFQYLKKEVA